MELFLNLAWAGLSVALVWQWLHHDSSCDSRRCSHRSQAVAMLLLIAILFPIISVSDDLMSAQNPAETDSLARRNQLASAATHPAPTVVSVPPQTFSGIALQIFTGDAPRPMAALAVDLPMQTRIQNRPPPAA